MSPYDWELPPRYPTCLQADSFHRTVRDMIFRQLSPSATPEQLQAAHAFLEQLHTELTHKLPWSHYGLSVGRHQCVGDLYREARARLSSLSSIASVKPEPPPPPAPPNSRPHRSPDAVVNDVSSLADKMMHPGDTFLGEERSEDTTPEGRS